MNQEMIMAILQALLGQDPQMTQQGMVQQAQYGRDYHDNPYAGEYNRYDSGRGRQMPIRPETIVPKSPKRRFESTHPKGMQPRLPGDFDASSPGDDYYNLPGSR